MLLRRCAWHRLYFGRRKLLGVASWRHPLAGIAWSDGCCTACARRVLAELRGSESVSGGHGPAAPQNPQPARFQSAPSR